MEIKILIADDHDIIRQGLKGILSYEEDIKVVGEASNGEDAIKMLQNIKADVLLLDFNMPKLNGIEVLKRIKDNENSIKTIMITVEDDIETIHKAIDIGADGYMLKDSAGTEIVEAIKTVYENEKYIDKSLVSLLFSGIKSKDGSKKSLLGELSKREMEVLLFISKGYSNKEIGEKLYLSEKTIKNYSTSIFRKIKVEDRVQATIYAIKNDIEKYCRDKGRD